MLCSPPAARAADSSDCTRRIWTDAAGLRHHLLERQYRGHPLHQRRAGIVADRPRVRVINVQDSHAGVQSAADLVHYLAWHGIPASVAETAEGSGSIAEKLLVAARDAEAGCW
jgi:hypothetical protein